ncbi:methylation-associated defense system protein kinase MAD6 [Deinococcus enclensis]|uniref:Serine/threonine protein kinase n=1 Tax=Deinococcus enclensis TaxID=1049582 RepID=A0ABT9MG33_9DEIO|nr:serine/threonine protein kinase [Deinococcus enclensis]MDP9765555.1 serine/threonine protein kinase [Deinococcus enclensis]
MAHVFPVGQPINDAERRAIATLRDGLPDDYVLIHNFEIDYQNQVFEVDLAIMAPHALYIVDVKGTRGRIDVVGGKWLPDGRAPFPSPLAKVRHHSKVVKDLVKKYGEARGFDMSAMYTDAAVILTAPDAQLVDTSERDALRTVRLADAAAYFQDRSTLPHWVNGEMQGLYRVASGAFESVLQVPPEKSLRFGSWLVDDHLGSGPDFEEYRAHNELASAGRSARLRVYRLDNYLPADERTRQRAQLMNGFQMLERLPPHPAVLPAREFFETPDSDAFVLVTEDPAGRALLLHLRRPDLPLTFDQKVRVAKDLLGGLAHAHANNVVHRAVTPDRILVTPDGTSQLLGFEYARMESEERREHTLALGLLEDVERPYLAPEVLDDPSTATAKSDVFSAGIVLYELFTGELPWRDVTELQQRAGVFAVKPSELRADLPLWVDEWVQALCRVEPADRLTAAEALSALEAHLKQVAAPEVTPPTVDVVGEPNYMDLPANFRLSEKFRVLGRLGKPGSFGAVYAVVDTFGDVKRAIKLLRPDRSAQLERLKTEYKTLLNLPEHPRVVRVYGAEQFPNKILSLVFEFVDGLDIGALLENDGRLSASDVLVLGRQVADGLRHMHAYKVYHCDIKPRNLMWSSSGVKIIDFNVAVRTDLVDEDHLGGTRRYLPPNADTTDLSPEALADRDVFALGVTLYEALSGVYPWDPSRTPAAGRPARPLTELSGLTDLDEDFAGVLMKAIHPQRTQRYPSAEAFFQALTSVRETRRRALPVRLPASSWPAAIPGGLLQPEQPNTNPFVVHLSTLYSQSRRSNSGTRGLSEYGNLTYADTALDRDLLPAVRDGAYRLVIVTGNAGDGKTAFLQQFEGSARRDGATVTPLHNGFRVEWGGRSFLANLDGSQDQEGQLNDEVLLDFFAPYKDGAAPISESHTRLIAINEGRLMDFLTTHHLAFSNLRATVEEGLRSGLPQGDTAVVNLNLRSVVAQVPVTGNAEVEPEQKLSIFDQQLMALTNPALWAACESCDLKRQCYALHNARTFSDDTNGSRVRERLRTLYTLVHLRGRLHITLRDLRSALAFTLTSGRDCDEIHDLYRQGDARAYLQGFYFNAWMGGESNADRLLKELAELDVARLNEPQLDRALDFHLDQSHRLFAFDGRNDFDSQVLNTLFTALPRLAGTNSEQLRQRFHQHRSYVAGMRRKLYFERRDQQWSDMIPFRSGQQLLELLQAGAEQLSQAKDGLLRALNRSEGIINPAMMKGQLALQVREVERGAIRSYRLFPADRMTLRAQDTADRAKFVEHTPTGLTLDYREDEHSAQLVINLDTLEMLERLNVGYVPSVEEREGRYLSLLAFKNVLASRPYDEVLLAVTDEELYRLNRKEGGGLTLRPATMEL